MGRVQKGIFCLSPWKQFNIPSEEATHKHILTEQDTPVVLLVHLTFLGQN